MFFYIFSYVDEGSLGSKPNVIDYIKIGNSSSFNHAPTCKNLYKRSKKTPLIDPRYSSQGPSSRIRDFPDDQMEMRYYNDLEKYNNGKIGYKPMKESYQRTLTTDEIRKHRKYNDFYRGIYWSFLNWFK